MRSHFNTSRRWLYVITSIVGGEHAHDLISEIVDCNTIFRVVEIVNRAIDRFNVGYRVDCEGVYICNFIVDIPMDKYKVGNITDLPGKYHVKNIRDYRA